MLNVYIYAPNIKLMKFLSYLTTLKPFKMLNVGNRGGKIMVLVHCVPFSII
jgi:hypothetical protein